MKTQISLSRSCICHCHHSSNQLKVLGSVVSLEWKERPLYVYHDQNSYNFVVEPLLSQDGVVNSEMD